MQVQLTPKECLELNELVMEKMLNDVLHFSTSARYGRVVSRTMGEWFQIQLTDGQIKLWEPRFVIRNDVNQPVIICQGNRTGGEYKFFILTRSTGGGWTISDKPIEWLKPFIQHLVAA